MNKHERNLLLDVATGISLILTILNETQTLDSDRRYDIQEWLNDLGETLNKMRENQNKEIDET